MKKTDDLIAQIRRQTDNINYGDAEGIDTEEFVYYLNDAQRRLQSKILAESPDCSIFDTSTTSSLVAAQRGYNIADSTNEPYLANSVRSVEYRPTSLEEDYYYLERRILPELSSVSSTYPSCYDLRNKQVLLSPIPSAAIGNIRVTFPRRLDALDIRRAKLSTVNNNGTNYTTLVLDSGSTIDDFFSTSSNLPEYFCVSDNYGEVVYYNGIISSYDSATYTLTLTGSLVSSGTISAGNWLTVGKFTTTHSKLPDEAERYLIAYSAWKILKRDSSADAAEQEAEVNAIENDLLDGYRRISRDISTIPVTNDFYLL